MNWKKQLKQFSVSSVMVMGVGAFALPTMGQVPLDTKLAPTLLEGRGDNGPGNGGDFSSITKEYIITRLDQLKQDYIAFANSEAFEVEYGHLGISAQEYIDTLESSNIQFSKTVLVDKLNEVRDALNFSDGTIVFDESKVGEMVNSREFAVLFQHEHLNLLGVEIGSFEESIKMWGYIELVTTARVQRFTSAGPKKDHFCKDRIENEIKRLKKNGDNTSLAMIITSPTVIIPITIGLISSGMHYPKAENLSVLSSALGIANMSEEDINQQIVKDKLKYSILPGRIYQFRAINEVRTKRGARELTKDQFDVEFPLQDEINAIDLGNSIHLLVERINSAGRSSATVSYFQVKEFLKMRSYNDSFCKEGVKFKKKSKFLKELFNNIITQN